jgi:hypothetical protein
MCATMFLKDPQKGYIEIQIGYVNTSLILTVQNL